MKETVVQAEHSTVCYFVTSTTKYCIPFFLVSMFRNIFIRGIEYFRHKYLFKMLGYVVMPDHFHGLIVPASNKGLSCIMRNIKAYSGREIARILGDRGKVWETGFLKHEVTTKQEFEECLQSMHDNPVQRGIVNDPYDYPYSSYRTIVKGEEGPLEIDVIDWE